MVHLSSNQPLSGPTLRCKRWVLKPHPLYGPKPARRWLTLWLSICFKRKCDKHVSQHSLWATGLWLLGSSVCKYSSILYIVHQKLLSPSTSNVSITSPTAGTDVARVGRWRSAGEVTLSIQWKSQGDEKLLEEFDASERGGRCDRKKKLPGSSLFFKNIYDRSVYWRICRFGIRRPWRTLRHR